MPFGSLINISSAVISSIIGSKTRSFRIKISPSTGVVMLSVALAKGILHCTADRGRLYMPTYFTDRRKRPNAV